MTTSNPVVVGGKIFDELAMSLAVSPLYKDNFLSASVVLSLQPLRRNEDGTFEVLQEPDYRKSLIYGDVFSANDPDILQALSKVQAALQELINKKGL